MNQHEPGRNVYIGHRYVPLLMGEWDKSIAYEGLSIVTYQGASYTSKKRVPVGIDIDNDEFWVLTGNYNAQVEYYRQETERVSDDLAQEKINLNERIDDTVEYVDTETSSSRQYVDNETASARQYVDNETASARQYVDTETQSARDYVDRNINDLTFNVKNFGALGENTDDTDGIINALNSDGMSRLYFPKGKYIIKQPIIHEVNENIELIGHDAELIFDFDEHVQNSFVLDLKKPVNVKVSGFIMDGKKMTNNVFAVLHDGMSMENVKNVKFENSIFKNVKRQREFIGGDCLLVRGGFNNVHLYNVLAEESELPEGQGVSGSQGVTGVTTSSYSSNAYVKRVIFENSKTEKIYSSDPSYTDDQDGLKCLAPPGVDSTVTVKSSDFINCYGRFIKTQVRNTYIDDGKFINTDSNSNGNVDVQYGGGNIKKSQFIYSNGRDDLRCINSASVEGITPPSLSIDNVDVHLLNGSKISHFYHTYPRNGLMGVQNINNINVYGTVERFILFRVNGDENIINIDNIYVDEIVGDGQRDDSFIQVVASGLISPYRANVNISKAHHNGNTTPLIVLDGIPGVTAQARLSSINMTGFSDENKGIRSSVIKSDNGNGFSGITPFSLEPDEHIELNIQTRYGTLFNLLSDIGEGHMRVYCYITNANVIEKGSLFELGDGVEPETGRFKVWFPESNKIIIKNSSHLRRNFTIFYQGVN